MGIFLALWLCVGAVLGGQAIQFNASSASLCAPPAGCLLTDPSIYSSGTIPSSTDSVFFNLTSSSPPVLLILPTGSAYDVSELFLSYVSLIVERGSSLTSEFLYTENTDFNMRGNAQITKSIWFYGTTLNVTGYFSHGKPSEVGGRGTLLYVSADSTILGNQNGTFRSSGAVGEFYGTLTFIQYSYFIFFVTAIANYTRCVLNFTSAYMPMMGAATFVNVNATFPNGFDGSSMNLMSSNITIYKSLGSGLQFQSIGVDASSVVYLRSAEANLGNWGRTDLAPLIMGLGQVVISSSSLSLVDAYDAVLTTLIFGGSCKFCVLANGDFFNFNSSIKPPQFTTGEQGEPPFVQIQLQGGAVGFYGNWSIPGNVSVVDGSLYIGGNVSLSGGLSSNSLSYATPAITVNGTLSCGAPIILEYFNPKTVPFFAVNSTITAPFIEVSGNFTFASNGTTIINGDLINNSTVYASETNNLVIYGSYKQLGNSTLYVYALTTDARRKPNLAVTGTGYITGLLQYSIAYNPTKQTKYTVITCQSVIGNYTGGGNVVYPGDVVPTNLDYFLDYSSGSISIVLQISYAPKLFGLNWWVWLIVGGSVVSLLMVVAIVRKRARSRRKGYIQVS